MKQTMPGTVPVRHAASHQPRSAPMALLLAAVVVVACWPQPAGALNLMTDTVLACCAQDTLLMTNQTSDTLTIDSIAARALALHTSALVLNSRVVVRVSPLGLILSNTQFHCRGDSVGDSLAWTSFSGPSRVPPTYAVWVQSPRLDAPSPPTAKRLNATAGDTMAVMLTFHSTSGDDSVVFFNGQASKAVTTGIRAALRQVQAPAVGPAADREFYTIRGERLPSGASSAAQRPATMLVVRQGHGGAAGVVVTTAGR
jgi:hypothetical protein